MIALRIARSKSRMHSEIVEVRIEIQEERAHSTFRHCIPRFPVPTLVISVGPENRSARPEIPRGSTRKQEEARGSRRQKFCEDELLATLQFPPPAEIERNVACAVRSPQEYKRAQLAQRKRTENFVS